MCRIQKSFGPMPPFVWAQCISKSRNRPDGNDDAAHRRHEAAPFAPRSGSAAYAQRSHSLLQQPECGPYFAAFGNKIVIRIDHQKRSELSAVRQVRHGLAPTIMSKQRPVTLGFKGATIRGEVTN